MKINLEVNKKVSCPLSGKFLEKVVKDTIKHSGYGFLDSKKITISLALVPEKEIKKINKKYRGRDIVTDVLSFANYESKKDILKEIETTVFLGELIICRDYIKKSARNNRVLFKKELARTVSHGVLHLLGFHHGKKMFSIQDKISRAISKK